MRIAILGFGKEGKSVLRFLKKSPRYKNEKIVILDKKRDKNYLQDLEKFQMIIKSPGVPFSLPSIAKARKKGVFFTSATALFFDHALSTIIGITGTKGKGTVATLLYRMLQACGKDAYLAGNIGIPMLDILPRVKKKSIVVLELSSFQLDHLLFSPRLAVILDIFPDHLDAHVSYREYLEAKAGIVERQTKDDVVFFFSDTTKDTKTIAGRGKGKQIVIRPDAFTLFDKKDLGIPGSHNYRNAVMAASVALYLGCAPGVVKKTALAFRGLPFRLQNIGSRNGILFYNDSAATNPHATAVAITSFKNPTVLIAGGRNKGFAYDVLGNAAGKSSLKHVIAVGENAAELKQAFSNVVDVTKMPTLEKGVEAAMRYIVKKRKKDEEWVVLFSPGAASFDMFENYMERGEAFNKIVKSLKI